MRGEAGAGTYMAQCINYLKASGKEVCLLVNFQNPRVEWKRVVWRLGWDEAGEWRKQVGRR